MHMMKLNPYCNSVGNMYCHLYLTHFANTEIEVQRG